MKAFAILLTSTLIFVNSCNQEGDKSPNSQEGFAIASVDFTMVHVDDVFWNPRFKTHKHVTIPSAFQKCEETGRIENFKVAGGLSEGAYQGTFPFDDSDVYKIIEGASYMLAIEPDPALEAYIDTLITYIAAAQEPDGYLHTWRTIDPFQPPTTWSGNEERWSDISGGHELYNMGHFYEASVAHYTATGKRTMLDLALKNADLILDTFGPGKNQAAPGHQEIEIGLVKLYHATGEEKYMDMAKFFLDQRGDEESRNALYGEYSQDHLPVTEQSEAVGHAVRAGYMYTAMADIAAITSDSAYMEALKDLWNNVTGKKIYLTGGIGARHKGESFGDNYELPNFTAYNETCAAISSIYWNYRMFLLTGQSKYMDVLERTLYNGMLAGVSLSGDHYFYPNPLASDGEYHFNRGACTRSEWFDCSCCPSNISRFMPSIPGYVYASRGNQLIVNLYMGNSATIDLPKGEVSLIQETRYPWDENVHLTIDPGNNKELQLLLRIPGWTRNEVMPGNLYHFMDRSTGKISIQVNGRPITAVFMDGYAVIDRTWQKGDEVTLKLPMEPRRVVASDKVSADSGKVAVECGPIVYCAEAADNNFDIFTVEGIPSTTDLQRSYEEDLLGGIPVITATVPVTSSSDKPAQTEDLKMVPYHLWSNRGAGKMAVWLPAD